MAGRRRTNAVPITDSQSNPVVDVVRQHNSLESLVINMAYGDRLPETIRPETFLLIHTLNAYQVLAMRTRGDFGDESDLINFSALEISSESGEVANIAYKHLYQGHELDKDHMVEELGDLLWGIASMADAIGKTLRDVAVSNLAKLAQRYNHGRFSAEDSIARRDHEDRSSAAGDQSDEGKGIS